jgi:lipopolysaccharide export system protein LptA
MDPRLTYRGTRVTLIAVLSLLYALSAIRVQSQQVEGSNFKAIGDFFEPPNDKQMKSLIQSARWRHQGSQTVLYDVKVQRFHTNGTVELIVEAPEGFYDETRKSVDSPGPVQFRTADGRFALSGVGYLWLQTNSTLYISNRVQTIVLPELLEAPSAVAATNSAAQTNKGVTILSDRFQYAKDLGIGIYNGNVRAVGTNVEFKGMSDVMEILVPVGEHQLQTITMSNNVAVDYASVEATGKKAVYTAATGLARITGNPAWHDDNQRQGRGDELVIDRTNRVFRANGRAWVKMPAQSMGANEFLSSTTNSTGGTNQFVEIFSDFYEFRTNSIGNFVQFGDHVHMVDTDDGQTNGTLTAATMLVTLLSTNELQSMVAEKNVVIQSATNQFTGEKAVYTATNGFLTMIGNPAWRSGSSQGTGDVLLVNLKLHEMDVRTNAWMRVPASQLGPSTAMTPTRSTVQRESPVTAPSSLSSPNGDKSQIQWPKMEPDPPTRRTGAGKAGQKRDAHQLGAGTNAPVEFADIFSETYTIMTNRTRFEGGVRIVHPRLDWVCQSMNVDYPNPNSKDVTMTAEQAVEFSLKTDTDEGQSQDVHGTCDHAVYNYAITPSGTNDTMTLTGNPILETTNGIFKNKILILDCANNKLMAPGPYKIYGTNANATPIPTNMFRIPTGKKK